MAQYNLNSTRGYPMAQTVNGNRVTLVSNCEINVGDELTYRLLKYKVESINEQREPKGEHETGCIFYDLQCVIIK